jgi:glycosyltransferase involved in cell wall biosynthesis
MKIGLVVPHIFMQADILPRVIFSPGSLALQLAETLQQLGHEVTLYTPGKIETSVANKTADMTYFEEELVNRETDYIGLLKSHPLTFITLARQTQSELIAMAYADANAGLIDMLHVYTNEEDIALPFASLCSKSIVFTHHDPFNLTANYKNVFPKFRQLNWLSVSLSQREGMPDDTNWVGNIYHGIDEKHFQPLAKASRDYIAYLGRIISPKGVHLAIQAVKLHNQTAERKLKLKIAGKHYAEGTKDNYWNKFILPELSDEIEYVGFIKDNETKKTFLGNAAGLIIPSTFEEPFGMVMIEALACGTPLLGLNSGAIPEVISTGTGVIVNKTMAQLPGHKRPRVNEQATIHDLAAAIPRLFAIDRTVCRRVFEAKFTLKQMAEQHVEIYQMLHQSSSG